MGISAFIFLFVFVGISFAAPKKDRLKEYEIAVTKGNYKFDSGDYQDAVKYFKTALGLKPSDKYAALLLGLSQSRAGQYRQAKTTLLYALRLAPGDGRIMYELGVVSFQLGEIKKAKNYFEKIKAGEADEIIKTAAGGYLYIISSDQVSWKKPFSIFFLTGLQYDSNVILEPTDPLVKAGRKQDGRGVFALDSKWVFLKSQKVAAEAGYMFYQSAHSNLDDFNVQQHNIMLSGKYNPITNLQTELKYKLKYSLIGNDLYSSTNRVEPIVRIMHSPLIASELYYVHEFKKYFNSETFSFNSQKTGDACQAGITENISIWDSNSLSFGYVYDWDRADAGFWRYKGQKGTVAFSSFLGRWKMFFGASYHDRKYESEFPGFSKKRHDGMQEYSLTVTWKPLDRVKVNISEIYVINSSNLRIFDYNRNIAGLFLEVRL